MCMTVTSYVFMHTYERKESSHPVVSETQVEEEQNGLFYFLYFMKNWGTIGVEN